MGLVLSSENLSISVLSKGAEISSIKNQEGLEFLWQADKNVWPRHAPVLFPIVGKLKDGIFLYEGGSFSLAQHGFARDQEFVLVEKQQNSCSFELRSDSQTKTVFPFDFTFRISYRLDGRKLTTTYEVTNPATSPLYFSIGAHPGFRCPLENNETFEDYYLEFDSDNYELSCLSGGLRDATKKPLRLKNNILRLTGNLFDNDALVFENRQINSVNLRSDKSGHKISLHCKNWPYFGIWSKKTCREFICLEPWFGIADRIDSDQQLSGKDGIIRLEAHKSFTCSFELSFE